MREVITKMMLRISLFLMFVGFTCGATWMGYEPMKPKELAHKTGCYIEEINDVIPYGEEITPIGKACYRIQCSRGMIDYASCGVIVAGDPKCHITEPDLGKSYPQCCPDVKCDGAISDIDNNDIDNQHIRND